MPGNNCSIYGCNSSGRHKGISVFKIPSGNDSKVIKWRAELVNIVTKYRVVDELLRERIASNRIYICEKHFSQDQMWKCKYFS